MTTVRERRPREPKGPLVAFFTPSDGDDFARRTWQYLRVAMVVIVAGLAWSVGYEVVHNPQDCWQTSLSAYYYTPVRAIFVGALVTIGVCLFCIKGRAPAEDALLNFAGVLAPVVAIVPTPDPGTCATVLGTTRDRNVNVANNMQALLFIGALLLVFVAVVVMLPQSSDTAMGTGDKVGYLLAGVVYVVTVVTFMFARRQFLDAAHYAAAITMFVCILGVVVLNAVNPVKQTGPWRRIYTVVAVLMIGSAAVIGVLALALPWAHAVIAIESALIGLFAVFWLAQTIENWNRSPGTADTA